MRADERLYRLAGSQLNLVTRHQALAAGVSPAMLKHRLRTGALVAVHRGVFALRGADTASAPARALAACLAAGPDAVASHETAAAVWGTCEAPGPAHLTVPHGRRPSPAGAVVHRTTVLRPIDRTVVGCLPVTTPARTLLDLAACADDELIERCLDNALLKGLVSLDRLAAYLDAPAVRTFAGAGRLHSLARDRAIGVPETELERALDRLYRRYRLPPGVRQLHVTLGGRRVRFDRAYPEVRIGIEADGKATHAGRLDWQHDLERGNRTGVGGWLVLRFTWWHIRDEPAYVAFTITDALGLLPSGWRPAIRRRAGSQADSNKSTNRR